MRILITNDDGIHARGINILADALHDCGEVAVVAPRANNSGMSAALTLRREVAVSPLGGGRFAVDGTPADCVLLALSGGFLPRPDIVVSGINDGANLGEDIVYSGTVAAAVCAHLHNIPALALSVVCGRDASVHHFDGAALMAKRIVKGNIVKGKKAGVININAPNIPAAKVKGWRITHPGRRGESEAAIRCDDNNNNKGDNNNNDNHNNADMYFMIGPSGPVKDGGEGTDFFAIAEGCISLTPLAVAGMPTCTKDDIDAWLK